MKPWLKDPVKARVVEFKKEFFLDYSKDGKAWKNYSVSKSYDKALSSKRQMSEFYAITEFIGFNPNPSEEK